MKKIKAYAILPAFKDNKEIQRSPFLNVDNCFHIYLTKKDAERCNNKMDESIEEVIITFK